MFGLILVQFAVDTLQILPALITATTARADRLDAFSHNAYI